MIDRMQQSRFELKYRLDEGTALRLRDFLRSHLNLDEHSAAKPNFSYPVHSLYLDSDDLLTFRDTLNGSKNRFKLRLRFYDAGPRSPVFFEIKRRINEVIRKERGGVRVEMAPLLLAGQHPEPGHLVEGTPERFAALQRFCQLMQQIRARPRVHVAFLREAYSSDDDRFRVTFDRHIAAVPRLDGCLVTRLEAPFPCFADKVILELKFIERHPAWYREMVETFGLVQRGASKYGRAVEAIGHKALESSHPVLSDRPARPRLSGWPPDAPSPRPARKRSPRSAPEA